MLKGQKEKGMLCKFDPRGPTRSGLDSLECARSYREEDSLSRWNSFEQCELCCRNESLRDFVADRFRKRSRMLLDRFGKCSNDGNERKNLWKTIVSRSLGKIASLGR